MIDYELIVITRIIFGFIALALFGLVCYTFGKSRAEIFPDDDIDNIDEALHEANLQGYEEGYEEGYRACWNSGYKAGYDDGVHGTPRRPQFMTLNHVRNRRDEDA